MRTRLSFSLALGLVSSVTLLAAFSPVSLGIGSEEYFGTMYARPPIEEVPFMFYVVEPIRFKVEFVNSGAFPETLLVRERSGFQLFETTVTKDGAPASVRVRLNPVLEYEDASRKTSITLGQRLTLQPAGKLTVHGDVESIPAEPGVYAIEVSTDLTDASGREILPQSTRFDFELRVPTADDSAELTRRSALVAMSAGRMDDAERLGASLLALNPNSSAAFTLRGQIAQAQGRRADALAMYRRSLQILEGNSDRLYLLHVGSLEREDQLNGLRAAIRSLGGQ